MVGLLRGELFQSELVRRVTILLFTPCRRSLLNLMFQMYARRDGLAGGAGVRCDRRLALLAGQHDLTRRQD